MKICYNPTYDLGINWGYSSPIGIEFDTLEDLKEQLTQDFLEKEKKLLSLDIVIDENILLAFDNGTYSVLVTVGDCRLRVYKGKATLIDIEHMLDEYSLSPEYYGE